MYSLDNKKLRILRWSIFACWLFKDLLATYETKSNLVYGWHYFDLKRFFFSASNSRYLHIHKLCHQPNPVQCHVRTLSNSIRQHSENALGLSNQVQAPIPRLTPVQVQPTEHQIFETKARRHGLCPRDRRIEQTNTGIWRPSYKLSSLVAHVIIM